MFVCTIRPLLLPWRVVSNKTGCCGIGTPNQMGYPIYFDDRLSVSRFVFVVSTHPVLVHNSVLGK